MYKVLVVLLWPLLAGAGLKAQVMPKEGSKLHYRIINFSNPDLQGKSGKYKLEVAAGFYNNDDSFRKNIVITRPVSANSIIAEVPAFGAQYTWRITSGGGNAALYHFATGIIPFVDTHVTRLRIINEAQKFNDAYVFLDGARALYDMKGNPVWYLPDIEGMMNERTLLCDLKMTSHGTITFMLRDMRAYEINYNGDVLWRGPNNNVAGRYIHYHHELTRRPNGSYMVLSTEPMLWRRNRNAAKGKGLYTFSDDIQGPDSKDTAYKMFPFGTLVEYDGDGKIIWKWKTADYVTGSDLNHYVAKNGMNAFDVHANAFFFDEQKKVIYLSFRDISRVIKISYPDGKVLATYGERFKSGYAETGKGLFCGQHSIRLSDRGLMYLYNNNVCNDSALPNLVMMKEPAQDKGELKKIWEYECNLDGIKEHKQLTAGFTSGGNVVEMPDHSIFASMSSPYGKVFIVSQDRNVLWSAASEQWSRYTRKWEMLQLYRASIITNRSNLEQLIRGEDVK